MKLFSIASFTKEGNELAGLAEQALSGKYEISRYQKDLQLWCGKQFEAHAACILFIGAAGIAVRTIAPFLKDKMTDPAVVVADEAGRYVIPILSGHMGGANEWAVYLAGLFGAEPVITTGTDVRNLFAADVFARKNHLIPGNPKTVKRISSDLLSGIKAGIWSEIPLEGTMPEELFPVCADTPQSAEEACSGPLIVITERPYPVKDPGRVLSLFPKAFVIGIGCRKGKTLQELEDAVTVSLEKAGIVKDQICGLASIDLKKEEPGLLELAKALRVPFETYGAEVLEKTEGSVSSSDFVKKITGTDSVCERAALAMAGSGGFLVLPKQAGNGITCAAAEKNWSVGFE